MSSNIKRVEGSAAVKNGVRRLIFTVISIALEITVILLLVTTLSYYAEWINLGYHLIALIAALLIYSQNKTASVRMPWVILILAAPIMGLTLYALIGLNGHTKKARQRYEEVDKELLPLLPENKGVLKDFRKEDPARANICSYLKNRAGYPAYNNTDVVYYDDAAKGLRAQMRDMASARSFIFMEYHAIEDKESWHGIQQILEQKVKEGVEVRVFYDDMGSIGFINTDFVKRLEAVGIRCRVFNPFSPGLNIFLNNRDHRKITVIDGKVGFTGGYNLANEYFNINSPFGHWKDTGVRLEGDAVRSLTVTFLEMWNATPGNGENDTDYVKFLPNVPYTAREKGYVLPYADSPMDDDRFGEDVYISVAETATNYAWFVTPYLIITDEMIHALGLAAKRGVDVRVITPGIPDKKMVYNVTRSYYSSLTQNGVRIYEYTPGFCHCKMSISDDKIATCGTINMDYRSFYHHFENGCIYYGKQAVMDTRRDFESMFRVSREVTDEYNNGKGAIPKLGQLILRLFAALF